MKWPIYPVAHRFEFAGLLFALALLPAESFGTDKPANERSLAEFERWVGRFQQARTNRPALTAEFLAEGRRLAGARRDAMLRLIREQPEQALNRSLRWRDWVALPAEIQSAVEEPFSEMADLTVIPDCRPLNERDGPWQVYRLQMHGANFDAFISQHRRMTSKMGIPVHGILLGHTAAISDASVLLVRAEELPEIALRFPDGNPRSRSWRTGQVIGATRCAGLIGGRVYHFGSPAELLTVSSVIAAAERRLGPETVRRAWVAATQGGTFDADAFTHAAEVAESEWTESPKRVLCLRLDFTPAQGTPYTYDELVQTLTQASDAIQVMSYDKTWIIPTVTTQVLVLANSGDYYASASAELANHAAQLAIAAGYVLDDYDIVIHSYPGPWAAFAEVGGTRVWLRGYSGLPEVETHELGHNYGLWHANQWRPQTGTGLWPHYSPGDTVTAIEHREYGDPFDIMGGSTGSPTWAVEHMNANMKASLNWIEPQEVATASGNGVYRLDRFDQATARASPGAKLALRVRNREGDEFWVSLRGALWTHPLLANNAIIVWTPDGPNEHKLLDTSPLSAANQPLDDDHNDCALRPGDSWTDPTGSLRVRHLGHGGASPRDYVELEVTHFPTLPLFELYTTTNRSVGGLVASFVNGSLSSYATQDDWRVSQTIAGTRVDTSLSFSSNSWGARAAVGLTNGTDADWENYSVQWDGYLVVNRAVQLKLNSGDGSRMWVDFNHDGTFATTSPEFINNGWGESQGAKISPATATLRSGAYPIRVQYEARTDAGGHPNHFVVRCTAVDFEFFTTNNLTTPGVTASFVNQSLRTYAPQDDWRTTQLIAGTRVQDYPGQPGNSWGARATVGLTSGTDANWGVFAAQWDGWLRVHQPTVLATASDASSRMWIDVDGDGVFGTNAAEFMNNHWGEFDQGTVLGENSSTVTPGDYRFRVQYDESVGSNFLMIEGRPSPRSAWLAFSDCASGNGTHPDATRMDIFGIVNPMNSMLRDVRSGSQLPVAVTITHSSAGVSPATTQGISPTSTMCAEAFRGYVDFAGSPNRVAEMTNAAAWVTYTFSGLNPAQRYNLGGAAIEAASENTNRWTLCELAGADSFQPDHSSTRVLTTNELPTLNAAQAVLNTDGNHQSEPGGYVGWNEIQPGIDGSVAITCRLYTGNLPDGSPAGATATALTALRLEEFAGPPAPPGIVVAPQSRELLAGQPFTLSVAATGTPLFYQWYKDYLPIPQANFPSLRVAGATTNDTGRYYVVVSNQFDAVASAVVSVGVYPDAASAVFRIVASSTLVTPNGSLPLRVTGAAARGWVVVEASTNFTDWTPVFTNWAQGPVFDCADNSTGACPWRFYRATIPANQPPPPNDLPSVAITTPADQSSFPVGGAIIVRADASDLDGVVTKVEFFASGGSLAVEPTSPYQFDWQPTEGSYTLLAVATDNLGGAVTSAPVSVTITPPLAPQSTFFESNGLVVIEAEHFASSSANSDHNWAGRTDQAGYVGEMAVQAGPNIGTNVTTSISATSPSMTYYVQFASPGTYNVWLRGWAAGASDDSVHLGLNGQVLQTLHYSSTGAWMWRSVQMAIPNAGRQEIQVWMREDGAYVDRLLLTTNLALTPSGEGPSESELPEENFAPEIYEWSPPGENWPPGEPVTVAVGASLPMLGRVEDFRGGTYTCVWASDRAPIETQTNLAPGLGWIDFTSRITYTPSAADVGPRTITLTVGDSNGLSDTHEFPVTVINP